MPEANALLSDLYTEVRELLDGWLTGEETEKKLSYGFEVTGEGSWTDSAPTESLTQIMQKAWVEFCKSSEYSDQGLEAYLRSEILGTSSEEVSMFLPLLLHVAAAKLSGWEVASKYLAHLKCSCPVAQMCLAVLCPKLIPKEAARVDFGWPRLGSYARYLPFWNRSGRRRRSGQWVAEVLNASLPNIRGEDARQQFASWWDGSEIPLVGWPAWKHMSTKTKLSILTLYDYEDLLDRKFKEQLFEGVARTRKSLAEFLGVGNVPDLSNFYGTPLLESLKLEHICKRLGHPHRQWDAMRDRELTTYLRYGGWRVEQNVKGILKVAQPEARVWIGLVCRDAGALKKLNQLPEHSFKRFVSKEKLELSDAVDAYDAADVRALYRRAIRTGFAAMMVRGGLGVGEGYLRENSIFMGLWEQWRPKVSATLLNKQFFRYYEDDFTIALIGHPEGCRHAVQLLQALSNKVFLKKIDRVDVHKLLAATFKHAWPMGMPLIRRLFEVDRNILGLRYDQEVHNFWAADSERFSNLLAALSGRLTVRRARALLQKWIDQMKPGTAGKLLNLKLRTGKRLGEYVLRWSLQDEALEHLLAMGGIRWYKMLFARDPVRHFWAYFKKAGVRRVLPEALRSRQLGELLDLATSAGERLEHMEWVRSYYAKKPTAALAFETALLVGVRHAPYLHYLAIHRYRESGSVGDGKSFESFYREHRMRKRRAGGIRTLKIPEDRLKYLQRKLLDLGFAKMDLADPVHGFRKGCSLVTNATVHEGREIVVNADIRDFFPSTTRDAVFRVCLGLADGAISPHAAGFIADLCCQGGVLPTGAPTSPAVANLILRRVDKSLQSACSKQGLAYTRYADDLTFSGGEAAVRMLGFATRLLAREGYQVHPQKVNIFRRGRRQMVTGLTVNERATLPRAIRASIRAAVHAAANDRKVLWKGLPVGSQVLRGVLANLAMTRPDEAAAHCDQLVRAGYFQS